MSVDSIDELSGEGEILFEYTNNIDDYRTRYIILGNSNNTLVLYYAVVHTHPSLRETQVNDVFIDIGDEQ